MMNLPKRLLKTGTGFRPLHSLVPLSPYLLRLANPSSILGVKVLKDVSHFSLTFQVDEYECIHLCTSIDVLESIQSRGETLPQTLETL